HLFYSIWNTLTPYLPDYKTTPIILPQLFTFVKKSRRKNLLRMHFFKYNWGNHVIPGRFTTG
ncbi:MAG: hypothetical protein QXY11_03220, partial [Desulfurococcaceae archaeon]